MDSSKEPEKKRTIYLPAFLTQCRCRCIPANSCCGCHACCSCCDLRVSIIGVSTFQLMAGLALGVTAVITFVEAIYNSLPSTEEGISKLDTNASTSQGLVFALVIYQQTRWLFTFATGCLGLTCSFSTALVGSYAARILRLARVYMLCCWLLLLSDLNALAYNPQAWRSAATGALAAAGFVPAPIDAYIVYLAWSYQRKLFRQQAGIFEGRPVMRSQAKPKHLLSLEHVAALHVKPELPPAGMYTEHVAGAQQPPSPQSMTDTRFTRTPAQTVIVGQLSRRPSTEAFEDGQTAVGSEQQDKTADWSAPEVVIIQQPRGPWSWLFGRREAHLSLGAQQMMSGRVADMLSNQKDGPEFELVVKPQQQRRTHPMQQQWQPQQLAAEPFGASESSQAVMYDDGVVRADLSQYWPWEHGHIDNEAQKFELPGVEGPQVTGLVKQDSDAGSTSQGEEQQRDSDQHPDEWSHSSPRSSHASHTSVLVHVSPHTSVAAASLFARQQSGRLTEPAASAVRLSFQQSSTTSAVATHSDQGLVQPVVATTTAKGIARKPRIEIPPTPLGSPSTSERAAQLTAAPHHSHTVQVTPRHGSPVRAARLQDSDTTLLYPPPQDADIESGMQGASRSPTLGSYTPRESRRKRRQELQSGVAVGHPPRSSVPPVSGSKPPALQVDFEDGHEQGPSLQRSAYQSWFSPRSYVPAWLWSWQPVTAANSAHGAGPVARAGKGHVHDIHTHHSNVEWQGHQKHPNGSAVSMLAEDHTPHSHPRERSSDAAPATARHSLEQSLHVPMQLIEQQSMPRLSMERRMHLRQVQSSILAGSAAKSTSLVQQAAGRARATGDVNRPRGRSRMHQMVLRSDQGSQSHTDSSEDSEQERLPSTSVTVPRDSAVSSSATASGGAGGQRQMTSTSDAGPRGFSVREWLFGQSSANNSTDASSQTRATARSMTIGHSRQGQHGMGAGLPPASRVLPIPTTHSDDGRGSRATKLASPHRHTLSHGAASQERVSSPPSITSPRPTSPAQSTASSHRSMGLTFQQPFSDIAAAQATLDAVPPTPSISRSPFAAAAVRMARKLRVPPPLQIPQLSTDGLSPRGDADAAPPSLQPWQQRGVSQRPAAPTPALQPANHMAAQSAVQASHQGSTQSAAAVAQASSAGQDASWAAACTFQLKGPTISQRPSANDVPINSQSRMASAVNLSRQSSGASSFTSMALPPGAASHAHHLQQPPHMPNMQTGPQYHNHEAQLSLSLPPHLQSHAQTHVQPLTHAVSDIEPIRSHGALVASNAHPAVQQVPSEGRASPQPLQSQPPPQAMQPQPPHRTGQRLQIDRTTTMTRVRSQQQVNAVTEVALQGSAGAAHQPEFVPRCSFMRGAQMQLKTPRSFKDRGQYGAEVNEQLSRALARMQAEDAHTANRPVLLPTIQSGVYERGALPSPDSLPPMPSASLVPDAGGDAYGGDAGPAPASGDSGKGRVSVRSTSSASNESRRGASLPPAGPLQAAQDRAQAGPSWQPRTGNVGHQMAGAFRPRRSEEFAYGSTARRAATLNAVYQPEQSRARTSLSGGFEQLRPPTPPTPMGQPAAAAAAPGLWLQSTSSSRGPTPPSGLPSRPGSPNPDLNQSYGVTQHGLLPTQASEQARPVPVWNRPRMQRSETIGNNTSRNAKYT